MTKARKEKTVLKSHGGAGSIEKQVGSEWGYLDIYEVEVDLTYQAICCNSSALDVSKPLDVSQRWYITIIYQQTEWELKSALNVNATL